jgi:hypothetical protein
MPLSGSTIATRRATSLRHAIGVRNACLKITNDRGEGTRREEPGSEGTGCVLADGRQLPQSGSHRCRHATKLPAHLIAHSIQPIRRGETGSLGSVGGGAEGMGAHVGDGCGLSGRSSGGRGFRSAYLARWDATCEAAADSVCHVQFAT